jgi:hypothetical protein
MEIYFKGPNIPDPGGPLYSPRTGGATPLPTDPGLFDQVGRMFRLGARTRF